MKTIMASLPLRSRMGCSHPPPVISAQGSLPPLLEERPYLTSWKPSSWVQEGPPRLLGNHVKWLFHWVGLVHSVTFREQGPYS